MGLGKSLVTKPTVDLELRGCSRGTVNDKLMMGMAMTFVRSHKLRFIILVDTNNIMSLRH